MHTRTSDTSRTASAGKTRGFRLRIYLFAFLMVFLIFTSFASTMGVAWYSRQVAGQIVETDFETRKIERALANSMLSVEENRKKFLLLGNPEYEARMLQDAACFREDLRGLKDLGLSDQEMVSWYRLQERFEAFVDPARMAVSPDDPSYAGVPVSPLEEIKALLDLNETRVGQRIEQMRNLEGDVIRAGLIGSSLSLFVAILLSFVLIRSITRPVDLLRKGTQVIATGKFDHRVELTSHDELGDLATAFNEMACQLQKLDDMKAEFMASVSHELKTPLTYMKESTDLLAEGAVGPLTDRQRDLLEINEAGIQRLTRFVEDILSLTRMEGGMLSLSKTRFDFQKLLANKLTALGLLAEKKRIRLTTAYLPDPPPPVYADPERLKQVLANLLDNAIRFTPAGGQIEINVAHTKNGNGVPEMPEKRNPKRDKGPWLRVSVSDNGSGIPADAWKKVFDKFFQVLDPSEPGTGSGLGLTIAHHIVKAHDGDIWVDASSEKGTTIVFALPQGDPRKQGKNTNGKITEASIA